MNNYKASVGEWWKPTTVLFTMKDLLKCKELNHKFEGLNNINIRICMDNAIIKFLNHIKKIDHINP